MISRRSAVSHGIASALALPAVPLVAARRARAAEVAVWNGPGLGRALATLPRDSVIRLKAGDYGDCGRFAVTTEGHSLVAEEGCVLHDPMLVLAAGTVISGQHFSSSPLDVYNAGTIVTNCDFSGHGINIHATATNTEVYACTFHDALSGISIVAIGASQSTANTNVAAYFHDNTLKNLMNGYQESLYIKASGNRIVNNTWTSCRSISSRCGSNNVIQGNTTNGSYGIVVQDDNNHVVGNKILTPPSGKGILIMAGDMAYTSNTQGGHAQAYNTEVSGNTAPLYIGKQYETSYTYPALNTHVTNHTGTITRLHDQGTTIS